MFAKVRWEDIWNAHSGKTRIQYRGFLKSRRVDFVIVKIKENKPSLIIELIERKEYPERTQRLKEFCRDTGIPLLLIRTKEQYKKEEVRAWLKQCLEGEDLVLEV